MKRVTVSVPDEVDALVREWADEEDLTLSQVYVEAVEAHVRARRRAKAAERVEDILERTTVPPDALQALHRERDASDRSFSSSQ
jgi:hypothetical protein